MNTAKISTKDQASIMGRTIKEYIFIGLKGMGMGAADVVPGVSGGTIAFISGIYEELLDSLRSIGPGTFKILKNEGVPAAFKSINGFFLTSLLTGVAISILSLSRVILYLLKFYPVLVWSFFFGLVVASAVVVAKKISNWSITLLAWFIVGCGIAYYITIAVPAETPTSLWFIFISGAIAICAMILPGISGSFILLLMNKYEFILDSLKEVNIAIIVTFAAGCGIGLLSFSHFLSWLFRKHHDAAVALLSGFMIGSLNKVWPWKITISERVNSKGELVPFLQENVIPGNYEGESFLMGSIAIAVFGFILIYTLESFSKKKTL